MSLHPALAPLPLACHPATPSPANVGMHAAVAWQSADNRALHLRFTLHGDLAALRIPPPAHPPRAADGLWQHTCFEAFVAAADAPGYREFNFSPSGDWAAYAFSAERVRDAAAPPLPAPRTACTHDAHRLTLDAWLPAAALPPPGGAPWRLGLSAVVQTRDGALSYWALRHPAPHPDFHHRAGWVARLPQPDDSNHISL
ncbi:MAG: DOMON-like domain-containing protein [Pseudomonadota bacterium]|nr:DOMON-like domain-containing protein [Pseudomonadota bacterium]